jgi:hypothetical protein
MLLELQEEKERDELVVFQVDQEVVNPSASASSASSSSSSSQNLLRNANVLALSDVISPSLLASLSPTTEKSSVSSSASSSSSSSTASSGKDDNKENFFLKLYHPCLREVDAVLQTNHASVHLTALTIHTSMKEYLEEKKQQLKQSASPLAYLSSSVFVSSPPDSTSSSSSASSASSTSSPASSVVSLPALSFDIPKDLKNGKLIVSGRYGTLVFFILCQSTLSLFFSLLTFFLLFFFADLCSVLTGWALRPLSSRVSGNSTTTATRTRRRARRTATP